MRRSFLLIFVLAGRGAPVTTTPHEVYLAAAAEFDRENAKLTQFVAAAKHAEFKARAICEFFRLSESLPYRIYPPRIPARGRGGVPSYYLEYLQYYRALPEVKAMRKQYKIVEPLRERANNARDAWIESERREIPSPWLAR